ncbi:MAG: DsbE family thiol:disulfide interchange protein [Pseudomonadota bacterium]
MAKVSAFVIAPPVIFAALAAVFFIGMQREDPDGLPSALIGQGAPALNGDALGAYPPVSPDAFADGTVKLVNFWASWCPPCRAEHPNLMTLAEEIPIYGVNKSDRPQDAEAFLAELGNPYLAIAADRNGRQAIDWGVYGLPETFVLDGQGRVVYRHAGPVTRRIMDEKIRPAIALVSPGS